MSILITDEERRRIAANRLRRKGQPPRLVRDCQGEGLTDPNDIIIADLEMLVAKSEALIGVQRTNDTLPDRLLLVMAARSLSRKG